MTQLHNNLWKIVEFYFHRTVVTKIIISEISLYILDFPSIRLAAVTVTYNIIAEQRPCFALEKCHLQI